MEGSCFPEYALVTIEVKSLAAAILSGSGMAKIKQQFRTSQTWFRSGANCHENVYLGTGQKSLASAFPSSRLAIYAKKGFDYRLP
jgi:hypothetical protein